MSSDTNPECNEAALQAQFERDTPKLRAAMGDANRDGRLTAAEIEAEIKKNPEGPLANLLRIQALPALRNVQVEMGALHVLAQEAEMEKKIDAQTLQTQLVQAEKHISERGKRDVTEAIVEPFMNVHPRSVCELSQEMTRVTDQALRNGFSITNATKEKVAEQMQRGVFMVKSLNSVEIGSVQVLYDHLATDEDKAMVKSGIDQRVKQANTPQQAPVKPVTTRC